jgi:hypothetical protein
MIYLGTQQYDTATSHEFYHIGKFYTLDIHNYGDIKIYEYYVLYNNNGYTKCEKFDYILPEKLNYIEYDNFHERMIILQQIIESKIYENL